MNLILTEIKNLNKVNAMKVWWELGLEIPEQADLRYFHSHLLLLK